MSGLRLEMRPKPPEECPDPDTKVLQLMKDSNKVNLLHSIPWYMAISYPARKGNCWALESASLSGYVGIT